MNNDAIKRLAAKLLKARKTLVIAESCTGGLLGYLITTLPGASKWFKGGVVTYSNELKAALLGVKKATIKKYGAVSKEVAREMVLGAKKKLKGNYAVAITGIAGPGGGTKEKPVGTVFIAATSGRKTVVRRHSFKGTRNSIKKQSALKSLKMVETLIAGR